MSFRYSLYVRCILSWGHALGLLGGLSTGQLNCCLPHTEEKRRERKTLDWAFQNQLQRGTTLLDNGDVQ